MSRRGLIVMWALLASSAAPAAPQSTPAEARTGPPPVRPTAEAVSVSNTLRPPAVRDTLRPPPHPPFDVIDAIELPFRIVFLPIELLLDGVFIATEQLTLPAKPNFIQRTLRSLSEARVYPTVGAIGPRSGISAKADVFSFEPFFLRTGFSIRGSQRHLTGVRFGERDFVELGYGFHRDAAVRFWGIGGTTPEAARSEYLRDRQEVGARAGWVSGRWQLSAAALYEDNRVDRALGTDEALQDRFDPLPFGARERNRFARFEVGGAVDLTHVRGFQRRGVVFRVDGALFRGVNGTTVDFHRLGAELHAFVPLNRRQLLAVRSFTELNRLDDGPGIPFFHLASVGSTTGLRGFSSNRFTDTDGFGVMSEWRWEVWRDLHERSRAEFFLFFDTGGVAPGLSNLTTSDVRFSWGMGMRLLTVQRYIGHWYLGFSEEGARFRIDNRVIF